MADNAPLILIVEDDLAIRRFLRTSLTDEGYRLSEAENGRTGLRLATSEPPELVLLDIGLPDMDGLEVLKNLREWSRVPVIILSARGQERDKVTILDAGANDYLTKPFGVGELLARIRVALRHSARVVGEAEQPVFILGDLKVDLAGRHVFVGDDEVRLTPIQYRLLTTLVQHAGKVLTHSFLLKEVWGPKSGDETHNLRVVMASLRQKLEHNPTRPRYLLTEQGVGYRLAGE